MLLFFICLPSSYASALLRVQIIGIQGQELKNAQARLEAVHKSYGKSLNIRDVQYFYQIAPREIRQALQPYGYFNPKIRGKLSHSAHGWLASFHISRGSPVRISTLDIKVFGPGKNNPALQTFLANFPLKKHDIFQSLVYEKAKADLFKIINNESYIKSTFIDNRVLINSDTFETIIIIHLHTEKRYYFGQVTFGPSPFALAFLHRFINFTNRDPFSSERLIKLQEEMAASNYFNVINIIPGLNRIQNHQVPIHILMTVPKSQQYHVGIGYGTYTGMRLVAGAAFRRLTDTGHHFDIQLKLSTILSGLAAKYAIPGKNPLIDQWWLGANIEHFLPQNVTSDSASLFGSYETSIHDIKTNINFNYLLERYRILSAPKKFSSALYPSLNMTYINADHLLNPHSGKSFNFNLQGASASILSSSSFLQAEAKFKFIYSPFSFARIITRGDLGYTVVSDLARLPASLRFYAGGINSIRGFPDNSIGPGRYLGIASIEYQNHIIGNWYGAIFYDSGKVTNHWNSPLDKGEGIGLIYETIIGPVKIYGAKAVSKPNQPNSIEFSIGPQF
jgi:translocation and assembly module TamA